MKLVTATCVICSDPFTYEYRGGPYRVTCSDEHRKDWNTQNRARNRAAEKDEDGVRAYPTGNYPDSLFQDDRKQLRAESAEWYFHLRTRPRTGYSVAELADQGADEDTLSHLIDAARDSGLWAELDTVQPRDVDLSQVNVGPDGLTYVDHMNGWPYPPSWRVRADTPSAVFGPSYRMDDWRDEDTWPFRLVRCSHAGCKHGCRKIRDWFRKHPDVPWSPLRLDVQRGEYPTTYVIGDFGALS